MYVVEGSKMEKFRFDYVDEVQLAAQVNAVMDAHLRRPNREEKLKVLRLAAEQLPSASSEAAEGLEEPECSD